MQDGNYYAGEGRYAQAMEKAAPSPGIGDRLSVNAERMVVLNQRLGNLLDRLTGPTPEPMAKDPRVESPGNMKFQMQKLEDMIDDAFEKVERLEASL